MAKLTKSNFFNKMEKMYGEGVNKVSMDQLSELLTELVAIGYDLPKVDVIKKWLKGPRDAADREFSAAHDAYMKTVGKDKSKWTELVEQLTGFSPVYDAPQYRKEYDELPDKYKGVSYKEWLESKELPAIFGTKNVNPARLWYARYEVDPLRGPGFKVFPGMKRREPKETIDPKWLKEHAHAKELMDRYRDEYGKESTNKSFEEWLNEHGQTLDLKGADLDEIRNHIIKQQNLSQDSDDPRVYSTIREEKPVGFMGLKEGEDHRSPEALRKLIMFLDSNRPWMGQTAFPFVDPKKREDVNMLGKINGMPFSEAVNFMHSTPGRLAQFLESHGYGAEKSNGEIKKKEFVTEPMDFEEIKGTMGDTPSVEDAEKRSERMLENTGYTRVTSGSNGRQQRIRINKDGEVVSIQSKGSKTLHRDPKTGELVEWTNEWKEKKDPKTGKTVKERIVEAPGSQNSRNRAEQMRKDDEVAKKQLDSYLGGDAYKEGEQKTTARADHTAHKVYGISTPTTDAEHKAKVQKALAALDPDLLPKDTIMSDARVKNVGHLAAAMSFRPGDVR